ncbi:MAG: ABC transporter permease [Bryobacterales bacterium]|nr:ABC transporter permease [Bryobacterales bacterium]
MSARLLRNLRIACAAYLFTLAAAGFLAPYTAPFRYETQFRDAIDAPASPRHPLGTDSLGRDRLSRLLYATRTSLLLAPAAALLSVLLAASLGSFAGWAGGIVERLMLSAADLAVSVPWLFLLITLRAALPLDAPPLASLLFTFALLGLLGWAGPTRVVHAGVRQILSSGYIRAAEARGVTPLRLLFRHTLPNLAPVLTAQFWTTVPAYLLAEANLGMLGLGVTEPLPSWGSLLRELEGHAFSLSHVAGNLPLLAPLIVIITVILSCRFVFAGRIDAAKVSS